MQHMQELLQNNEDTIVCTEEILLFGATMEEHGGQLAKVMKIILSGLIVKGKTELSQDCIALNHGRIIRIRRVSAINTLKAPKMCQT